MKFMNIKKVQSIYIKKAENEKVGNGNVTERRCHRLKASLTGKFLKCIRELIR